MSPELTFTLLDFFITNLTRSGFKLIEFNSYEIEFGLELMKMLNLAPNPCQRKSRLIPRPSLSASSSCQINKDNLKIKNEDKLQNEDNLQIKRNPKMKTTSKMKIN